MDYLLIVFPSLAFVSTTLFVLGVNQILSGRRQETVERLENYTRGPESLGVNAESVQVLRDRRLSRFDSLNNLLLDNPMAHRMALELAQAQVPLKPGEYILLRVFLAAALGYATTSLGSILFALVGVVIGFFAPQFYVSHLRARRTSAMEAQLVDALSIWANSLRAGWGFMQAIGQAANELPPPLSEELTRVLEEVGIGATPEQALNNLVHRVPSYDLELIITAVMIQRQVGGNLAEMMDNMAHTIRERIKLLRDVASITAESRLSMWLLSLLPIFLLVVMYVIQADYMLPFLMDPRGRLMLLGAALLEVVGVVTMRRIGNIKV